MKLKIILISVFTLIGYAKTFSQETEISFDSLTAKPYDIVVNKTKYRLTAFNEELVGIYLQKFTNKWQIIDTLDNCEKIKIADINNDGFKDIILFAKWNCLALIFNQSKNKFIKSEYIPAFKNGDIENLRMINQPLNIFFDYGIDKNNDWFSVLFQFKNSKRIDLAKIKNFTDSTDINNYKQIIQISKIVDDKGLEKQIEKIHWQNKFDFEFENYWNKNWQKFLRK